MPYSIKRSLKRLGVKTDKEKTQKEMSALSLELGELQSKVKEYKDYTDDIVVAKKELKETEDKKGKTEKYLKDEIILLSTIKEEAGKLREEIEINSNLINAQSISISKNKELLIGQNRELEDNNEKLLDLKKAVDDKEEKLSLINLESKEDDKVKLENDITGLESEISEKTKEKSNFEIESSLKSQEIEGKKIELLNLDSKIVSSKSKGKEIDKENTEKKERLKKELQKIEDSKKEEWAEREGNLSIRENWLNEKTETLRANKIELEKYFSKKIPNLII